ncbi:EI24 domain-containing protein [Albidovulum sediminicola]|uniref:EI24 domain-containing protein n=1 Tax=Albidovulum sediminicola TaxID=2984331 RepID=A0ABT2Z3B5_9RHOB|nr:EI24 domain-containing protein [Defluviimonas sp. WL0075]MCV2865492.1 EI24 domain-containing protein [Defluviimonas sp. WL0075]
MFTAFLDALGQLGDRRFLRVVLLGVALSTALLVAFYGGLILVIDTFTPDSFALPWVGEIDGLHTLLGWGSLLVMIVLSIFLMVPVAAAFSGIFLDAVAEAVEARHYPHLPPAPKVPMGDAVIDAVNFTGVLIGVNALALMLWFVVGPFAPFVFWALNGYLIGREYFQLAAMRRIGRQAARQLRRDNRLTILAAGMLMAAPLTVPIVNLFIPVLGAATFTHIFHRLNGTPN